MRQGPVCSSKMCEELAFFGLCLDGLRLRDTIASFLSGAGIAVLTRSSAAGALRLLPLQSCSRRFGPLGGLAMDSN